MEILWFLIISYILLSISLYFVFDKAGEAGWKGLGGQPVKLEAGMNSFLKEMGVTFRRDKDTKRPRVNKESSKLDREQKKSGKHYYQ